MRLIDAEPIEKWLFKNADKVLGNNHYERARICAFRRAFELVRCAPTVGEIPNFPLTLEEMREMEGEPVWYVDLNRSHPKGFWAIIAGVVSLKDCEDGEYGDGPGVWLTFLDCQDYGPEAEYGKTWLAYRRKLEEGEM